MPDTKPHTERWAYQKLYTPDIFAFATRLYPWLGRLGSQVLSRTVAWVYAVTQPAVRRVVKENLSLLQKEAATEADAVKVFLNFGATIADYVIVGAMEKEKALALCAEHRGLEHLHAARQGGQGVILATGHYSFFEFGSVVLGGMGIQVTIATLPEPSDGLMEWRANWRRRWGTKTIPVGVDPFSSLQVIRAIEQGDCMAMLADRPIGETGLPVDLPNGRILFSTSPALLAWMTGCPILPVVVTRRPDGLYRITARPAVTIRRDSGLGRKAEIERCTREIAEALFEEIREAPHQWYQFVPVGLPKG
jgi:KDO2-lipid IV(A) lauroyltransferase